MIPRFVNGESRFTVFDVARTMAGKHLRAAFVLTCVLVITLYYTASHSNSERIAAIGSRIGSKIGNTIDEAIYAIEPAARPKRPYVPEESDPPEGFFALSSGLQAANRSHFRVAIVTMLDGFTTPEKPLRLAKCRHDTPSRYAALTNQKDKRYFLAMNAYNNEEVLPTVMAEMGDVISLLVAAGATIFVSIVENGSDDQTPEMLRAFAKTLKDWGISNKIVTRPEKTDWNGRNRIDTLVDYRNEALAPLYESDKKYDRVIFYNDIYHCSSDILELLLQFEVQGADMVCPVDWVNLGYPYPALYDAWVLHTMTGELAYRPREPKFDTYDPETFFSDEALSRFRWLDRRPVQVMSCWNGVTIMSAKPLQMEEKNVRFRSGNSDVGECKASECELICRDFWKSGHGKIAVVPRVAVSYELQTYELLKGVHEESDPYIYELDSSIADEGFKRSRFSGWFERTGALPENMRNGDLWKPERWWKAPYPEPINEKLTWRNKPPEQVWCLPAQGLGAHDMWLESYYELPDWNNA
ncbi:hypothetical protein YB2330_000273 [Saitoella coloradoensis]